MIPSSIKGPAVDPFEMIIRRLGSTEEGFDLRLLAPLYLDRPDGEEVPQSVLQHTAWWMDVDILGLPYEQQVLMVKEAVSLHRRRGTKWAIRRELQVLGFVAVSVMEGNTAALVHDGTWTHDGTYVHGGDRDEWAVFRVAMLGIRGFDARLVLAAIERGKNARSRLIGLTITLRYTMPLTADIETLQVNCVEGDFTAGFVPESYMMVFDVPEAFAARTITGFTALDSESQPCGVVQTPAPIIRGSYAVRVIFDVNRNLGTSAEFDDAGLAFDDVNTQFDD